MQAKKSQKPRIFVDLERLNRLDAGCPACGHKFTLGDEVVLGRGKWDGFKYIHVQEAVFDIRTDTHYERKHYRSMNKSQPDQGK